MKLWTVLMPFYAKKIVKNHPTSRVGVLEGCLCDFFSSEGRFLQILGRNYFWSGGGPSTSKFGENITTHLLFFDWDFVREKLKKKIGMYIANEKKIRFTKNTQLLFNIQWIFLLSLKRAKEILVKTFFVQCKAFVCMRNLRNEINHLCYREKDLVLHILK